MSEQSISCPNCKTEIPLSQALSQQVKENIENQVSEKLRIERDKLTRDIREQAAKQAAVELRDLQLQNQEKDKKLAEARAQELEIRRQKAALEDKQKSMELDIARKIDEERKRISDDVARRVAEEHHQKDLQKDKLISDLRQQAEEFKRKAEQGSQQTQGEVLELELENQLRARFPFDEIEPVGKGARGADIVQRVHNKSGRYCGTIIWESKQTKAWQQGWVDKLKVDQREIKAEIAVLVSNVLPKEFSNFGQTEGIWITNFSCYLSLAIALRVQIIQVALTKVAVDGALEKKDSVYNYLTGTQFKQRVEAIVEATLSMKDQLEQEKRAMTKLWAMREKQIERVNNHMTGVYGDLQGLGASLPSIRPFELQAPEQPEDFQPTSSSIRPKQAKDNDTLF